MKGLPVWLAFCLGAAIAGCSAQKGESAAEPAETRAAVAQAESLGKRQASNAALALPVPISTGATPTASGYVAESPITEDTVYSAVLNGMGPAAADIDVVVDDGMVYLKGYVKNEADFQAANYIARALPGVDDVDQRALRIR